MFCKKDGAALDPDVLRKDALYPILDKVRDSAKERRVRLSYIQAFGCEYTHTSAEAERDAAIALERAIYGDLFPVVPNIENRNNSAALN